MKKFLAPFLFVAMAATLFSCTKEDEVDTSPRLVLKFKFDSTQVRLNNLGQPQAMLPGNAGQHPRFNKMSAHYIELAPSATTALGAGTVLYYAAETNAGGAQAIDFERAFLAGDGQLFYSAPLKDITPGEYEWLRVSLAYQNFDIKFYVDTVVNTPAGPISIQQEFPATVAGFIGYNSYIKDLLIKTRTIAINDDKLQGFWAFETTVNNNNGISFTHTASGQAPANATTVPNPLAATSPIPPGSCVVTAAFTPGKLRITGTETSDLVVEVSLSTNKSFEWTEVVHDGKWEPAKGEGVTDMGIRGMIPRIQ